MPGPQMPQPTPEQVAWLRAHPQWQRISHTFGGRYPKRGTLMPDGTMVEERPGQPVTDGGGSFSVALTS